MEVKGEVFIFQVFNLMDMNKTIKWWRYNIAKILVILNLCYPTFVDKYLQVFHISFVLVEFNNFLFATNCYFLFILTWWTLCTRLSETTWDPHSCISSSKMLTIFTFFYVFLLDLLRMLCFPLSIDGSFKLSMNLF
jgi:hypothetical protein